MYLPNITFKVKWNNEGLKLNSINSLVNLLVKHFVVSTSENINLWLCSHPLFFSVNVQQASINLRGYNFSYEISCQATFYRLLFSYYLQQDKIYVTGRNVLLVMPYYKYNIVDQHIRYEVLLSKWPLSICI